MRGKGWIVGWLVLVGLGVSTPAMAACTVPGTTSPASFGSISSMTVRTAAQTSSTTNAGLNCGATLISLLAASDHFYATITSATSGMVGPTGDVIGYTIYGNNSTSYPITRGVQFDFGATGIAQSVGLVSGPGTKTLPLYLSSITGSNVAAGLYTETLSIAWVWNYCSVLGVGTLCVFRDSGTGTANLTVSMTVSNDCQITAPNISFGSAPVISGFSSVNGQATITCTKGSAYTVGISDGLNPVSVGGQRRMVSGSNFLNYDIFKSATTTRWGSVTTARRASSTAEVNPGNGLGTGSQVFNYNAAIYPNQATPPAGTYTDNVVLDVGF
ncbi:Csu type fimbrial protein [Pseudomonas sp. PAMC 25886]|uniref:Csu type fimbrial protein n=1 Tax=Pseudomonas sp. PAMC 25886 TaxID=1125977 RepID=UPI0003014FA1|nr:spore coat U domain-containing protein [Pseudomonas sp. PAMC 25886]